MMPVPALVMAALAASACGWGLGVTLLLRVGWQGRLEQLCVSTGLGTLFLALSVFGLSLAGHLRRPLLFVLLGGGVLVLLLRLRSVVPAGEPAARTWPVRLLRIALASCVIANFIGALAPISFIDAMLYHVYEAREFLRAGRLIELRHAWQSYQPISVEMLYTLGMGLLDDRLPPLVDWGLGVLALFSALLLGRRIAGPLGGLIAAAAFYCTAMVAWESTSCFVELGIAVGATLGTFALLRWNETDETPWLIVAGLMAGFAATCKLTAAQLPVYLTLVLLHLSAVRKRSLGRSLSAAVIFAGISLALVAPWYLRSFLLTGNPVYPFLPSVFGANPTNHEIQQILAFYGSGKTPLDLLLAPWHLVSRGSLSENGQYLNPLPFLFAPMILWRARKEGPLRSLLLVCVLWFLLWLKTAQIARYLVPVQAIACALVGDAAVFMLSSNELRRRIAVFSCVIFIGFSTLTVGLYDSQFLRVVFGAESRDAYLARTSWYYTLYQELGRELPADAYVLTDESPTYHLLVHHDRLRNVDFLGDVDRLRALIRERPYTHILIHNSAEIDEVLLRLRPMVERVWRRHYSLASSRAFGGSIPASATLYRIAPAPGTRS